MKILTIPLVLATGCAWTTFDDLSKATPAQAIEKPDAIKASDFAVAVVGVSQGASGGRLSVLSSGSGTYATFDVAADGTSSLGDNENLGVHTIDALTGNAMLITDGTGQVSLVDNSNVGTVVIVHGPATGLNVDTQVGTSLHPIGATYAGGRVIVTVDPMGSATATNTFDLSATGTVTNCILNDNAGAPLSAAAIAANTTTLFAWAKSGALLSYSLAALDTCPVTAPPPIAGSIIATTTPGPMNGGHIDLDGAFAVLTAYDAAQTMTGQVTVVDTATAMTVGTPLIAHGVHAAIVDSFGGQVALVLGYPNRAVGSTSNAGAVDIHSIDASGNLSATPTTSISLPNSPQNHVFGRTVTTMKHNATTVVVVGASDTVYAYFKTSLYADTRTP